MSGVGQLVVGHVLQDVLDALLGPLDTQLLRLVRYQRRTYKFVLVQHFLVLVQSVDLVLQD